MQPVHTWGPRAGAFIGRWRLRSWLAFWIAVAVLILVLLDLPSEIRAWNILIDGGFSPWEILSTMPLVWLQKRILWEAVFIVGVVALAVWQAATRRATN